MLKALRYIKNTISIPVVTAMMLISLNFIPSIVLANPNHGGGTTPSAVSSFQNSDCNSGLFAWLEPWYNYLPAGDVAPADIKDNGVIIVHKCDIVHFTVLGSGSDIAYVLIAIADDLLRIAGLVSVAFVLYGAFKYVGSQGSAEQTSQAQGTIINALIGLAVACVAVVLVNFLGNTIK